MPTAMVVAGAGAQTVERIGMRCDSKGVPTVMGDDESFTWWFSMAMFGGRLLKKRPAKIALHRGGGVENDGDSIVLQGVARYFTHMGRIQTGQESAFLKALTV